jgi:hypothetical protein
VSDQKRVEPSWVEELYRYAEYYHGERQHLMGPRDKVRERMRRTEVPLNAILNIALRLLPASITERLLQIFLADHSTSFGALALRHPYADDPILGHTVQPDVSLKSETARVFIELKVNATFSLEQVQKYVLLHAPWNDKRGAGRLPFLLLLSPRQLYDQWEIRERGPVLLPGAGPEDLLSYLRAKPFPAKLGNHLLSMLDQERVSHVLSTLRVGATTWQPLADAVQCELSRCQDRSIAEAEDTTWKLLKDLLGNLNHRNLWKSSAGERTQANG